MSYTAGGPLLWPIPPDWSDSVVESLEWLTDVQRARNGRQLKRQLRQYPRRSFSFGIVADGQARRVLDTLLNARGGGYFLLPIWHEVQLLDGVAEAMDMLACRTAGFEFAAGGQVALWLSPTEWWVAGIVSVGADHLVLDAPTERAWPAGTRLYPVCTAHLLEQPRESGWTDSAGRRAVQFLADEPSPWPAILPAATYRGLPVLERRPDAGEDIPSTFARSIETVDASTGPIALFDWPGRSFREASVRWIVHGRSDNADLRSLLHALRGRMQAVWLPTWNGDLQLAAPVGAAATQIVVDWSGYALFGRQQPSWRDICIERFDGTVWYRRIVASSASGSTETLTLDSALGQALAVDEVRGVSFMVPSEPASDSVELEHVTDADGLTRLSLQFRAIRDDL